MARNFIKTHSFIFLALLLIIFIICNTKINSIVNKARNLKQIHLKPVDNFVDDVYEQLIDLKNFRFIINSQICEEGTQRFLVVVMIFSRLTETRKRAVIRETWGQQTEYIKFVYLIGATNDTLITQMIKEESLQHRDIIQGNFVDSYRNLTYKHVMGLKWASHHCPRAKYVVKVDSDTMVNTILLYNKLKVDTWNATGLIACRVLWNPQVFRSDSKWAVSKEEYPKNNYPNHCYGPFIIYSADVVRRLLDVSRKAHYFWIDDVHVSGTLAKMVGIKHVDLNDWSMDSTEEFIKGDEKRVNRVIFGLHGLDENATYKVWKIMKYTSPAL